MLRFVVGTNELIYAKCEEECLAYSECDGSVSTAVFIVAFLRVEKYASGLLSSRCVDGVLQVYQGRRLT